MSNSKLIILLCVPYLFHSTMLKISINPNLVFGISILAGVLIFILITLVIRGVSQLKNSIAKPEEESKDEDKLIDKPLTNTPGKTPILHLNGKIDFQDKLTDLNNSLKPFGFAYDSEHDHFYSLMYPWQREYGYCQLYDESASTLSLIIDCEPIYFDYNGKKWLIEFWKGQYGRATGGEIGIYNTDKEYVNVPGIFRGTFYHAVSDEERLEMAFTLVKNQSVFLNQKGLHWWLSGFKLGEFSYPLELQMYIEINFNNSSMREAFVKGLIDTGYTSDEYSEINNTVYIIFDTPHTNQPYTRSSMIENIMQENNRRNIELFYDTTQPSTNTVDRMYTLHQNHPEYYQDVLNIGKPKNLFAIYHTIKNYLD